MSQARSELDRALDTLRADRDAVVANMVSGMLFTRRFTLSLIHI